jgi:hypothetical protein
VLYGAIKNAKKLQELAANGLFLPCLIVRRFAPKRCATKTNSQVAGE